MEYNDKCVLDSVSGGWMVILCC